MFNDTYVRRRCAAAYSGDNKYFSGDDYSGRYRSVGIRGCIINGVIKLCRRPENKRVSKKRLETFLKRCLKKTQAKCMDS